MATLLLPTRPVARSTHAALTGLLAALDARDSATGCHCRRVAGLSLLVANELDLPMWEIRQLERAALLHDVGKIGVPDAVLLKPDKLSYDELVTMQTHAAVGASIVAAVFPELVAIVRSHHETWDGYGYPDQLKGEQVPQLARIIAVCDSWDAMTEDRCYRKPMTVAYASQVLKEGAGSQWDAELVEVLLQVLPATC